MLRSISIQNYALIHQIQIDFNEGFSVITGETGSGKSILLGALSLLLGQRADVNVLRSKSCKCVIEGVFDIQNYPLKEFFQFHDLDYEVETVIRREILPSGKSRAFVNDTPVNVKLLKELGARLIDIHSQNQNLVLGDAAYQLYMVDTFAQHDQLLKKYKQEYKHYCDLAKELQQAQDQTEKSRNDLDYFQFQFNQLQEANLQLGEQQEMEQELETLNHAEEIKGKLYEAVGILSGHDMSVLEQVRQVESSLGQLLNVFSSASELHERISSTYIELQDLSQELEQKSLSIEFDPQRIEFLNQRLDLIYSLEQKHRVNHVDQLLDIQHDLEVKIEAISTADDIIDDLIKKVSQQEIVVSDLSNQLTESRSEIIPQIEVALVDQLQQLGMPNVSFKVDLLEMDDFSATGKDRVVFLFSANKNGSLQEISKVASGGEMSRFMLSLKSLVSASSALPSIVFDEIDTGVSGEIADRMGGMMQQMSGNIQVISITHLPQIASKGTYHYKVYKADDEVETYSNIVLLNSTQRVEEVAKMLSGSDLTAAAFDNARVLLNN